MAANAIAVAILATVVALGPVPGHPGSRRGRIFTRVKRPPKAVAMDPAEWREPTSARTITGTVSYYGAGLMAKVVANRGLSLEGYAGGVALMRRGDLGRVVWLQVPGPGPGGWQPPAGPFLVVDCAEPGHYAGLVHRGRVAEVSRATWLELGLPERPVRVVVRFEDGAGASAR